MATTLSRPLPGTRVVPSLSLRAATAAASAGASAGAGAAGDSLGLGTGATTATGGLTGGLTAGGTTVATAGPSSGPLAITAGSMVAVQVQGRKLKIHVKGKHLKALVDNKAQVQTGSPIWVQVLAVDEDNEAYTCDAYFGLAHKPADMLSRREKKGLAKQKKAAAAAAAAAGDEDAPSPDDIQADPIFCFVLHVPSTQGELGVHVKDIKSAKFRDAKTGFLGRMVRFDNDFVLYDGSILGTENAFYFETPDIHKFGDDVAPEDEPSALVNEEDGSSSDSDDKPKKKQSKEDHVILIVEGDVVVPVYDPQLSMNIISVGSGGGGMAL